jgi:hypothetical protein
MRDPFIITEPTCISFSGGRTSSYLLWRVLQSNNGLPEDAIVCFANTGKEEEATLEFVRDCGINWGVKIHWIEYTDAEKTKDRFKVVDFETASRNGEPFEQLIIKKKYLPNPVTRFCTIELGIRADEMRRAAKVDRSRVPLVTAGITAGDVGQFWKEHSFDLKLSNIGGKTLHGNCDLCFLKGGNIILSLIAEKPERAVWWAKMETMVQSSKLAIGDGGRFRNDRPSYASMAKFTDEQAKLFTDEESIACFCGD